MNIVWRHHTNAHSGLQGLGQAETSSQRELALQHNPAGHTHTHQHKTLHTTTQGQKTHGTTKRESHLWDRCNLDDGVLHDVRRLPRGLSCRGHRHGSPSRVSVAFDLCQSSARLSWCNQRTKRPLAPVCDSPLRKHVWMTMYARTHTRTHVHVRSHKRAHTQSRVHTRSDPRFAVAGTQPCVAFVTSLNKDEWVKRRVVDQTNDRTTNDVID